MHADPPADNGSGGGNGNGNGNSNSNGNGNSNTGKAKTKKDRDDALESMKQGKPNQDAAGFYKGGSKSKRAKFAETMNQFTENLGKLRLTRHCTWWSQLLSESGTKADLQPCMVLCSQMRPVQYAAPVIVENHYSQHIADRNCCGRAIPLASFIMRDQSPCSGSYTTRDLLASGKLNWVPKYHRLSVRLS
jgi:hypothetical protein